MLYVHRCPGCGQIVKSTDREPMTCQRHVPHAKTEVIGTAAEATHDALRYAIEHIDRRPGLADRMDLFTKDERQYLRSVLEIADEAAAPPVLPFPIHLERRP